MDIFSQHYDSSGVSTWRPNGLPVIITPGNVGIATSSKLLSLKNGRAIACWTDYRSGANGADIYCARFDSATPVKGPLAMLSEKTNVTCYGGSDGTATALPYGGTTPYTFAWSNGATTSAVTGLVKGTYSVTVTDNLGAQVSALFNIQQPPAPALSISSVGSATTCGEPVMLNCVTTGAVSYQWQKNLVDIPGATSSSYLATSTGNYKCKVNYTCTQKLTPPLAVSITVINANITPNGTIDVCTNTPNIQVAATPNSASYSYQWYNDDVAIPGANTHSYKIVDVNHTFYVVITHIAKGCVDTSNTVSVFKTCLTAGGTEVASAKAETKGIKIYPNPASSSVNVDLSGMITNGDILLKLTDVSGRQVMQQKISGASKASNHTIDVSRQTPGIYMLTIQTGKEQYVQKIVVVR